MSVVGSNALAGASGQAGATAAYKIERSLRFNDDDSAYLNRTPSSAGNRKKWTWSGWVKRSALGSQKLFIAGSSGTEGGIQFHSGTSNLALRFYDYQSGAHTFQLDTNALFVDPCAWTHIVGAIDTSQATASDRCKLYINGEQVTSFATATYPSQNLDTLVNNNTAHYLGWVSPSGNHFDGYLAEVHFIDGQQLSASDFGEYDGNNVWQAKEYTAGSYGANGFHLDFADPADLGDDNSGNGNDWTPNGLIGNAGLATANQGFDVVTYTGTGNQLSISSLQFQPDLVWIKRRDGTAGHSLHDVVRGVGSELNPNTTAAEDTQGKFVSFDSNGWTMNGGYGTTNLSGQTFVAWCWKAGGTASSNTDGSQTSSVSANTTYGFSVVTGTQNANNTTNTYGHGLGAEPKMIVLKRTNGSEDWYVYHKELGNTSRVQLNSNAAVTTGSGVWGSTTPTSSVFTIQSFNAGDFVAYCWSEVSGFSKFGKYTGDSPGGQTNTVTITTGFKPKFILIKRVGNGSDGDTAYGGWGMYTSTTTNQLMANCSGAEGIRGNCSGTNNLRTSVSFNDDGFSVSTPWYELNDDNVEYIYAAFADKPDQSAIDSLIDTPTNYEADSGNNGGNYATFNPLDASSDFTLSNGNLDLTTSGANSWEAVRATIGISSGKYYWEWTAGVTTTDIGVSTAQMSLANWVGSGAYGWSYDYNGQKYNNGSGASYGNSYTTGDVIGVAFDADAGNLYFYKNGAAQNSGTAAFTGLTSGPYFPAFSTNATGGTNSVNFGQRPFAYTPPTGYKSLCTTNLPDPTIADGSDYFQTALWTGNGGTQSITTTGMSPDFVWIKKRSGTTAHNLFDTVRGANKPLFANLTNAELSDGRLTAFNSDGFTLDSDNAVNDNNQTHVGWAWDAGANSNKTYAVKVVSDSGNKYRFDDFGSSAVTLDLEEGSTYVFDQSDSSNSGHPLRFSTTSDGTHNSGSEYTTGVTTTGTPGSAGAKTTIVVGSGVATLYYYCSAHSGMGGQANTNSTAGASNFDGTIQSTVKASQTSGFSIVSYIGSATAGTIGHQLNAKPSVVLIKTRDSTDSWFFYTDAIDGSLDYNQLEGAGSFGNSSLNLPTSSVFYVGSAAGSNKLNDNFIAYCFAPVAGYSAFGSYSGNGSEDGPFVFTGFRPKFLLIKNTSYSGHNWVIFDTERNTYNLAENYLAPNTNNSEYTDLDIDILSNGFKIRTAGGSTLGNTVNYSTAVYIFAAFAEHPFKTARAR
jgi:hypothetical protein